MMDEDHLQAIAARDQLWSSLRVLRSEIERIAEGEYNDSPHQREVVQLLARIVVAELQFRAEHAASD
jgi:hypothetical protein